MLPDWGDRNPRSITKRDAGALFDKIIARDAPAMANDVCSQAKQFFKWLADNDHIDANPIVQTEPGGKEYARDRWLDDDELPVYLGAMKETEHPISLRVRLAQLLVLATIQRSGEIVNMMHAEIDRKKMIWTIPGDVVERRRSQESGRKRNVKVYGKTKNGLQHIIPLSPLALAIIDAIDADVIKQYGELQRYVVAGFKGERTDDHVEDKALARSLRNSIKDPKTDHETLFGLEPFTPHDLRRTGTTHLSALKVLPHIKKRIINHTDEDDVTEKVYDCWDYINEKRAALMDWQRKLLKLAGVKTPQQFVALVADRARHVQKGIPKPRRKAA
jgi:integrase